MNTKSFIQLNDANNNLLIATVKLYFFQQRQWHDSIICTLHTSPALEFFIWKSNPQTICIVAPYCLQFLFILLSSFVTPGSQCFFKRQYTAFVILTFLFCFLSFFPLVRFVKVFMPVLEIRTYGNLLVSGTCTLQIKTNTSHIYNFLCSSNNKLEGWTMLWACKVVVTIN